MFKLEDSVAEKIQSLQQQNILITSLLQTLVPYYQPQQYPLSSITLPPAQPQQSHPHQTISLRPPAPSQPLSTPTTTATLEPSSQHPPTSTIHLSQTLAALPAQYMPSSIDYSDM